MAKDSLLLVAFIEKKTFLKELFLKVRQIYIFTGDTSWIVVAVVVVVVVLVAVGVVVVVVVLVVIVEEVVVMMVVELFTRGGSFIIKFIWLQI